MFDFGDYRDEDEAYKRKVRRDELLDKFFTTTEKEPQIDRDKADRLQRMGRINTLSRAGGVLGDVLSTALGANVKQRQPDNISPMLYQNYQNMLDKYKSDMDAYDYRSFQKELQNISVGLGELDKEEALAMQRAKNALDYNKQKQDWDKFNATHGLNKTKAENQKAYQDERNRIAALKAEKDGYYTMITMNGKSVGLDEGQFWGYYNQMLLDKSFSETDFKAMMEKYNNNGKLALTGLIQKWVYKKEQEAMQRAKMAGQQPTINKVTAPSGVFPTPPPYGVNGPRRQPDQTYPSPVDTTQIQAPIDSTQIQTPIDTTQVYTPVAPLATDSIPMPVNPDTLQQTAPIGQDTARQVQPVAQDSITQMQAVPLPVAQDSIIIPAPAYDPNLVISPRDAAVRGTGQIPVVQDTIVPQVQAEYSPRQSAINEIPIQRKPKKRGTFFTPIN